MALRRQRVRALALAAALVMLSVVGLSAYIRLAQSIFGAGSTAALNETTAIALARLAHRVTASLMLVLALALALATLARRPRLCAEGRLALAVLGLTLALAVLGMAARGSTLPAVVLGNLLGGYAVLALCWRLAASTDTMHAPSAAPRAWARGALLLAALAAALGGLVSATASAGACDGWSDCARAAWAGGWDWRHLNPWQAAGPNLLASQGPRGAWLSLLHRAAGVLLVPLLMLTAATAWRERWRANAVALALLLGLLWLLGPWLTSPTLVVALAHNLAAALLIALLARLA